MDVKEYEELRVSGHLVGATLTDLLQRVAELEAQAKAGPKGDGEPRRKPSRKD